MCVACIEYIKNTLNFGEFKSALREMTQEDKEHAQAVARLMNDYAGEPEELKRRLKELTESR